MRCPNPHCNSSDNSCNRKYKTGEGDANRTKYAGMNLDRRRYVCFSCGRPFYTIEVPETDFEQNYYTNQTRETKSRIR